MPCPSVSDELSACSKLYRDLRLNLITAQRPEVHVRQLCIFPNGGHPFIIVMSVTALMARHHLCAWWTRGANWVHCVAKRQRHIRTPAVTGTPAVISYYWTYYSVALLVEDNHKKSKASTLTYTKMITLLFTGRQETGGWRQTRCNDASVIQPTCLGYGVCTGRLLSNDFSFHELYAYIIFHLKWTALYLKTPSLLMTRCCQTVYTGQVCPLSPICYPKMDLEKGLTNNYWVKWLLHCDIIFHMHYISYI